MEPILVLAAASILPVAFRIVRDLIFGRRLESGRTVKLEVDGQTIELTNVDDATQRKLIEKWLAQPPSEES